MNFYHWHLEVGVDAKLFSVRKQKSITSMCLFFLGNLEIKVKLYVSGVSGHNWQSTLMIEIAIYRLSMT